VKPAIICLTNQGYSIADSLKSKSLQFCKEDVDIYAPEKIFVSREDFIKYNSLSETVKDIFPRYKKIIFIMALGIVVRVIAPLIKDKTSDPAVVVIDEAGRHVISVLSGHLGGANNLARDIANALDAEPVITTATDVWGLPAVDELARENKFAIEPVSAIKGANSAIINGKSIHIYSDIPLMLKNYQQIKLYGINDYPKLCQQAGYNVIITNRIVNNYCSNTINLRPQNLVMGIGCRSGTTSKELHQAIKSALIICKRSELSLRALATIDRKAGEQGLILVSRLLNLPIISFSVAQIDSLIRSGFQSANFSNFVQQAVGVPAVSEPAAILASRKGELILPKIKFRGITIAIAEDAYTS